MNTSRHLSLVKAIIFPVVMYGCESWTIKKAESRRTDAFELWCWWRLLRVPWTARRSNQSILKEISPEYSLEGLMLKLKLQYFGHLMQELTYLKRCWCWERLKVGGEGDNRGWDGWMTYWLDGHEFDQTPRVGEGQGSLECCSPWGRKESDMTEQLNWTKLRHLEITLMEMEWKVGGRFKREGTCIYLCLIILLNGRSQHNILKQLSSN